MANWQRILRQMAYDRHGQWVCSYDSCGFEDPQVRGYEDYESLSRLAVLHWLRDHHDVLLTLAICSVSDYLGINEEWGIGLAQSQIQTRAPERFDKAPSARARNRRLVTDAYPIFSGRQELHVHLPDIVSVTGGLAAYLTVAFVFNAVNLNLVLRPVWFGILLMGGFVGTIGSWAVRLIALEGVPILGYAVVRIALAKGWHHCSFNGKTELPTLFAAAWFLLKPDIFGPDIMYIVLPLWVVMNLAASIGAASKFWMSWVAPRLRKQGQIVSATGNLVPSAVLVVVLVGQFSFVASLGASDLGSFFLVSLSLMSLLLFGDSEMMRKPWFARVFAYFLALNFGFFYTAVFIILIMQGMWQLTHFG